MIRMFRPEEIRRLVVYREVIDAMRGAVIAQARGECDTPMPMHLAVGSRGAEVHIKSSYRRGGEFLVLKAAGSFPARVESGKSSGSGMMTLLSAQTGDPVAFFEDEGWMTDVRTAAVAAMAARELGRRDVTLGVLGTGIQARLQAVLHAEVLPLETIHVWGRTPEHVGSYRRDMQALLPAVAVFAAPSPADVARATRLVVTTTPARLPLLEREELAAGTHVSAVGADAPGKQELHGSILESASLLLVDSLAQCERLGELQNASPAAPRAVELGAFCDAPPDYDREGITVADFTGLGVEDLAIAEYVYRKAVPRERG
jgi:ornithine cyclodeaminase